MRKLNNVLLFVILFSVLIAFPVSVWASEFSVRETITFIYASSRYRVIPSADDSMSNPDYEMLSFQWYTTINYYVNPTNSYGLSKINVVNAITTAADTWDNETTFQVFTYKDTTSKTAGKHDGYNVVSWGRFQLGVIAVTYIWSKNDAILETDCRMNNYYSWSLSGAQRKMDVQNIMTHEFGHWCGLDDLYAEKD